MYLAPPIATALLLAFCATPSILAAPAKKSSSTSATSPQPTVDSTKVDHSVYTNVLCNPIVSDARQSSVTRWAAANASQALSEFDRFWNQKPASRGGGLTWVGELTNRQGFGAVDCGVTTESCDFSSVTCADKSMSNPKPQTPGDWLIMRSSSNFHKFYTNYNLALGAAQDSLKSTMGTFVSTFAPGKPDESLVDKIFDGFQEAVFDYALDVALGPLGNFFKEELGEEVGDKISEMVKSGLESAKDLAKEAGTISWNAYEQNGFKNGYKLGSSGVDGFKDGAETLGLYQIPICDVDEAIQTYQNTIDGRPLCDYGGW